MIDDSAGQKLADTPVGAYLRLAASCVADSFTPVSLLALLKHPLSAAGQAVGEFRARVRKLEVQVLRGPRPAPDQPYPSRISRTRRLRGSAI